MFPVVERGHGDVVGDAIGDEDEVIDFVFREFVAEFFREEAVVELFACFLDGVEVVAGLEGGSEVIDEFGEFGFTEGTFGLAKDSAFGGPEDAGFVFEDQGIDEDGVGLVIDDFPCTADEIIRSGSDRFITIGDELSFDIFDKFVVGFGKLSVGGFVFV